MGDSKAKRVPDFFDEDMDPVKVATGKASTEVQQNRTTEAQAPTDFQPTQPKKKVSYYFPKPLIEDFDNQFFALKMAKVPLKNKSALMEAMVKFALEDLGKGAKSKIIKSLY